MVRTKLARTAQIASGCALPLRNAPHPPRDRFALAPRPPVLLRPRGAVVAPRRRLRPAAGALHAPVTNPQRARLRRAVRRRRRTARELQQRRLRGDPPGRAARRSHRTVGRLAHLLGGQRRQRRRPRPVRADLQRADGRAVGGGALGSAAAERGGVRLVERRRRVGVRHCRRAARAAHARAALGGGRAAGRPRRPRAPARRRAARGGGRDGGLRVWDVRAPGRSSGRRSS